MELKSCLYECHLMHHRLVPKEHKFLYKVFMFYLDLDELDACAKNILLLSHNRANVFNFKDSDHVPFSSRNIKANLLEYLGQNGIHLKDCTVKLLTNLRTFGYVFNPISIYFVSHPDGSPACAVAEVGNTFGEQKLYLIRAVEMKDGMFYKVTKKYFYVSPFMHLENDFEFKLKIPGENLEVHVNDKDNGQYTLLAALTGKRAALTNANVFLFLIYYPLITLKVIGLIHWNALLLYLKGIRYYKKSANMDLQKEVLRPHSSLPGTGYNKP